MHPEWVLKHRKPGTEIKCIKGYYYVYEVSSVWDPEKKRPRKISGALLGKITKDQGFVPRAKYAKARPEIECKNHG